MVFDNAMAKLKVKKSSDPDEISKDMIINLGPVPKTKLLQTFRHS